LTDKTPNPLLKLNNITLLENCINLILKFSIKKIFLNTFYLESQILEFVKNKNFSAEIHVINDGREILNTGGGILNMTNYFKKENFIIFNPNTLSS
jgi:Nucleoside-diphosphate-sugar pyrophosphorylase involved in lipopolysaccharide biosynthesis/translation initiation factor 2B, gamma/epsilon subunits (eIF-2Bgamma/eIF-2Bepsilon)